MSKGRDLRKMSVIRGPMEGKKEYRATLHAYYVQWSRTKREHLSTIVYAKSKTELNNHIAELSDMALDSHMWKHDPVIYMEERPDRIVKISKEEDVERYRRGFNRAEFHVIEDIGKVREDEDLDIAEVEEIVDNVLKRHGISDKRFDILKELSKSLSLFAKRKR